MTDQPTLTGTELDEQLWEFLLDVLVEQFKIPVEEIKPEADLFSDLGLDSLDLLTTMAQLEERFGIEIDERELEGVRTVSAAIEYFRSKL